MLLHRICAFFGLLIICLVPLRSSAQYQINGNATQTSCNCYQLTPAAASQSGSVWNVNLLDLSVPFNFTFDVFLGCNEGGADGMAFVLQPLSVNAGSSGGGIGYQGISPSLAVELDNYQNTGEPAFDHMAIQRNGDVSHGGANTLAGPVPISATTGNVEDCAWHQLNIVWDPATQTFTVYFDGVLRLTYTGDIVNNIFGGNPNVYWGFTSATGGANNLHQFCNALNPAFIIASPLQCEGLPVDFESASAVATGQITDFQWDFGDGTTGSGGQISHTYNTAGVYDVTLTISSEGCTESSTVQVTINPAPNFSLGTDQAICDGDSYQITATGLAGGEQLTWNPVLDLDNPGVSNPLATPTTTTTYTLAVADGNGCLASDDIEITVNPLPVADAGPDQTICNGEVVTMAASGGVLYSWNPTSDLVDGASPTTVASPTATTAYTVTVTDANGCESSDDMTITVNPLPVVTAGLNDSICDEQTVQLQASGAIDYTWNPTTALSDPLIANPIFSGSNTTTFTVTGTDANGCENTDDVELVVYPLPTADFSHLPTVCLNEPINFTDNSNGNGLTYAWSFGDGSPIDMMPSTTHTYTVDGNYTVDLNLVDVNGCQASASSSVTVFSLPEASMNIFDGQEFCELEPIQFENETSGTITSTYWNFGDNAFLPAFPNTSSTLDNPVFAYSIHVFSPYTITLGVIDQNGCSGQTQVSVVVHDKPVANFSSSMECEGNTTQFQDESTVSSAVISSWEWDFGDGSSGSNSQNPSHAYGQTNVYTAELIAQSDYGCADTISQDVIVNPTPVIDISGIDTCLNDETAFFNNSTPQDNTIISWDWDFDNGNIANGIGASHTYLDHGIYNVSLTATTDSGCVATGSTQIEVFPNPEPAFTAVEAEGCTPHEVLFIDETTIANGQLNQYEWSLGDGTITTSPNPTITYVDSGYYDVSLSVTSTEGCNTFIEVENAIRANITPVADFSIKEDVLSLLNAEVVLTDQSEHALSWDWNLGDGTLSTIPSPTHIYDEPGTYELILTVTNGDCQDTKYGQVKVEPIFAFYIPSAFTPDDDGVNETFFGTGESISSYNMIISNRWGELLFESNNPDFHWDGTYKGKQVEAGVYVYRFHIFDEFGEFHQYTGSVNLLR